MHTATLHHVVMGLAIVLMKGMVFTMGGLPVSI